jgi:hypothetical protein
MAFDPYTATLVEDKKKFDPFNAIPVEDKKEFDLEKPEQADHPDENISGLEAFLNKGKLPSREEKAAIERAQPGLLGDTSYGHALYGSLKSGLAGLFGEKDGQLTPGALRVLEEAKREDTAPTMEDVFKAYGESPAAAKVPSLTEFMQGKNLTSEERRAIELENAKKLSSSEEGVFPAAKKFLEAAPYTIVRTSPQIAAGALASAMAPEAAITTGLGRVGLGELATLGEGVIPRAIAAYPTQVPFNYSGNILEQQQAREAQIERGEEPTPISPEKALAGAAGQSALDALIAGQFAGISPKLSPAELLTKAGTTETAREALSRIGRSALEAGVENIAAEPAQEVISRAQAGEELTSPEAIRAYEIAALSGAPMSAAGVPKGISTISAPVEARQTLNAAAERADQILNPAVGSKPEPLTQSEFEKYGELMAHAMHAQTLGIKDFEKTPEQFYNDLKSRVDLEPEQLHELRSIEETRLPPSEQPEVVGETAPEVHPDIVAAQSALDAYSAKPNLPANVRAVNEAATTLGITGDLKTKTAGLQNAVEQAQSAQVEEPTSYWNKYTHPITNTPYAEMSLGQLQDLRDNAVSLNNKLDYDAIEKHFGKNQADAYMDMNRREKNKWWDENATEDFEQDSSVFKGIDEDTIDTFIESASLAQDMESPEELGTYLGRKMKGMSGDNYVNSPEYFAVKEGLKLAQEKGWSQKDVIDNMKRYAVNYAGEDAAELFPTLFKETKKVEAPPSFNQLEAPVTLHDIPTKEGPSKVIDYGERKIVMADVNGTAVPFYLSTGFAGKKNVAAGKWYPILGLGKKGWINKGSQSDINSYYGSPELKQVAQKLDEQIGDIRQDTDHPSIEPRPIFQSESDKAAIDFINSPFSVEPADSQTTPDAGDIVSKNIQGVLNKIKTSEQKEQANIAEQTTGAGAPPIKPPSFAPQGVSPSQPNQPINDNWSNQEINSLRQKIDKLGDKAKTEVLKALSATGVYDLATDQLLPGGKPILEATRQADAEKRHNVTKVAEKIRDIHKWLDKHYTKRHILDDLTSEATILGAKPDDAAFMQNLKDSLLRERPAKYQESLARLNQLETNWRRLGKDGQDVYKMMRQSYRDTLTDMYSAMKNNVMRLSSLSNEEKAQRIQELNEQLASIIMKGDYFPIMRYGNWGVAYKEEGENKYTKFETRREAEKFVNDLVDKGLGEGYLIKDSDQVLNTLGIDTADFNKLYNDIKDMGEETPPDLSELKDMLFQAYLMSRPETSISKRFIHRKGTAGYSNDAVRAFAKNSLSMANQLPRIEYGRQILDGLAEMKHRLPKEGEDNAKSQYYYEAFKREIANAISPEPTNAIAGFLTQFGFDAYLTSVASAVNQLASVPMLAFPAISKRHGFGTAQSALNTATKWYIESGANHKDGWWNIERGIDKQKDVSKIVKGAKYEAEFDPKDAYEQLLINGVIDSTLYMQAFDAGKKPTGAHEDVLDRAKRIMNVVAIPFGQLESASRQIGGIGAYIAGIKSGMHHQQAVEAAIDMVYRDMGDYGSTGRSKLAKSTLGRIAYQFQQYQAKLFHSIGLSVRDIFSDNPEDRKIALKHLGALYAMHYLMAGLLGLPGAGMVGSIVDEMEDLMDEDEWHSYEANLKSYLNKLLPENDTVQNIILEGPLATALGVDLKSRLGAQDILPLFRESEMNDGIVSKSADKLGKMVSGIPTVGAIGTALDHYESGDYGKALLGLFPNAQVKSIANAYRYETEGKVTPKGGTVVSPKEVSRSDVAKRAIGYEPLSIAQKSTAAREQASENRFLTTRKSKIQEDFVNAIVKDDKSEQAKALKVMEKFSNKNPAYAFEADELSSAIKSRYKYLETNTRGQNIPLKQLDYYLNKVPHLKK